MADSKIRSPLFCIKKTVTINGGYASFQDARFINAAFVADIHRNDDVIWNQYTVYPRVDSNGWVFLYFRDTNGNTPADGSKAEVHILGGVSS